MQRSTWRHRAVLICLALGLWAREAAGMLPVGALALLASLRRDNTHAQSIPSPERHRSATSLDDREPLTLGRGAQPVVE